MLLVLSGRGDGLFYRISLGGEGRLITAVLWPRCVLQPMPLIRRIPHSLLLGGLRAQSTESRIVLISVFFKSYMLTSSLSKIYAYPASIDLLVLINLFLIPGTMRILFVGSQMLIGSFVILLAGAGLPPIYWKILSDVLPVEMKGSAVG
jgi:hypothetical protein